MTGVVICATMVVIGGGHHVTGLIIENFGQGPWENISIHWCIYRSYVVTLFNIKFALWFQETGVWIFNIFIYFCVIVFAGHFFKYWISGISNENYLG